MPLHKENGENWPARATTSPRLDAFVPDSVHGYEHRARARYLAGLAFLGLPFWLGFAAWYGLALGSPGGAALLALVGAAGACIPFLMRRTGSVLAAAHGLAATAFTGITVLAILRGGFPAPVLLWSLAIPVAAALQRQHRSVTAVWLPVCIVQLATFYVLARTGNAPTGIVELSATQLMTEQMVGLIAFAILLVMMAFASDSVTQSFADDRDDYLRALLQSQRAQTLGRMAGGLAHDVGNLLTVIDASAARLRMRLEADHPGQDHISDIDSTVQRARALTRQLAGLGREQAPAPAPISLNDTVRAAASMVATAAGGEVTVETQLAPALPAVRIDPSRVDQILLNLTINAADAMRGAPTRKLTVITERSGSHVVLEVADTGCGIPRDHAERLFEPFFSTKDGTGTGLGLWMSRTIAREAGGDVTLESDPGRGTRVRVHLPAVLRSSLATGTGVHETVEQPEKVRIPMLEPTSDPDEPSSPSLPG